MRPPDRSCVCSREAAPAHWVRDQLSRLCFTYGKGHNRPEADLRQRLAVVSEM